MFCLAGGLDSDEMFGDIPGNFTEGSRHCKSIKTVGHSWWLCFTSATIFSGVSFHTVFCLRETGDYNLINFCYKTFTIM